MTQAEQFVEAARRYIGTRWMHMGRTPHGLDCVGLILLAAGEAGIGIAEPAPYPRRSRGYDVAAALAAMGQEIPLAEAREGDVLVLTDGVLPCHVGIRATLHGLPSIIHANAMRRTCCEDLIAHEVEATLRTAYRPFPLVSG